MANKKQPVSYADAGVDVERGYETVKLMKGFVAATHNKNVLHGIGSFGGFYALGDGPDADVLVAGTDGVGTKLKYAIELNKHDTIGIDAVAMCVNDIVCQAAKPLFFLDYIAQERIIPTRVAEIVKGIAEGCKTAGCALIGGETAEHPGFGAPGDYDIAGFSVGIVKRKNIINGSEIKAGDVLIGLASSGLHSNGFSLVRKLLGETRKELEKHITPESILEPCKIYVNSILALIEKVKVKGIANITGGGFIENIPRMFPKGIGGVVDTGSFPELDIFKLLRRLSGLDNRQLYNTFNMGIGMVLAVDKADADTAVSTLKSLGETAYKIGFTTSKPAGDDEENSVLSIR